MAVNKAKRSIHVAQPERRSSNPNCNFSSNLSPQPAAELMPVKAHMYRALAELNGGFEKVVQDLNNLHRISFFRSERLEAMQETVCELRAQANREFLDILSRREAANTGHFERLRLHRQSKAGESKAGESETPCIAAAG